DSAYNDVTITVLAGLSANAGPDRIIARDSGAVVLDGSASTGTITSYHWRLINPTAGSDWMGHIDDTSTVRTGTHFLTYKDPGSYYDYELQVSDGNVVSMDTVRITVIWGTPAPPQKIYTYAGHSVTSSTLSADRIKAPN